MFIKNVNARQGTTVYLEHKVSDEFSLALSFQPHNIRYGDLIVLTQNIGGKVYLTHIVMVLETQASSSDGEFHDKKIKVRVTANAGKNILLREVLNDVKNGGISQGKIVDLRKVKSIGKEKYPMQIQSILDAFAPYFS